MQWLMSRGQEDGNDCAMSKLASKPGGSFPVFLLHVTRKSSLRGNSLGLKGYALFFVELRRGKDMNGVDKKILGRQARGATHEL